LSRRWKKEIHVGHIASILFFTALLVALAVILELIVKAHWAAIVDALAYRAPAPRPRPVVAARAQPQAPSPRHAAA
jgi:hypothetical protein